MRKLFKGLIVGLFGFCAICSADVISGIVTDSVSNSPISGVSVSVNTAPVISTSTDAGGNFSINTASSSVRFEQARENNGIAWQAQTGTFSWTGISGDVSILIRDIRGATVSQFSKEKGATGSTFTVSNLPQGIYIASVKIKDQTTVLRILNVKSASGNQNKAVLEGQTSLAKVMAVSAGYILTFTKAGYTTTTLTVSGNHSGLQVKMQPQQQIPSAISFSPPAGPFYAAQPVTITTTISGASIRYTTDGSTPTATNGTLYNGPVTMQQAVNTDMSQANVTNASGVTMLKAVAYKGTQVSDVFTGNYIIIVPLRYAKTTSLVLGLAHMAYNVSSTNWNSVLSLWTNYMGFDTVMTSPGFALIKINDQQYIELYQKPVVASQFQLANYGFYVSNAEAFRQQISKAGVKVPTSCTVNALGNLSFLTTDPDGHVNEWVQYQPNSVTSLSLGKHMPGTQVCGYMDDYGDAMADVTAADNYYSQCGFDGNGTKVYLPNSNCYLEMLTYSQLTQTLAGKHEKAQLVTFRGVDVLTVANKLQAKDASIVQVRSTEGGGSFPTHNCVDVYNADLSRIRMIDLNY